MRYSELIDELNSLAEEDFCAFQKKIVNPQRQKIIGVRTPVLRGLVKKYKAEWKTLLTFPDDYYEVTFIKLNAVALLPYEEFCSCVEECVGCIENWAICDTFKAACIKKRRDDFLPYIRKFLSGEEFSVRYALVTLLSFYVEKKYLSFLFESLSSCNCGPYYVHMAAAWLTAEILIKEYADGIAFLKRETLPVATHNKAIQKARESFRLTATQKEELIALKR